MAPPRRETSKLVKHTKMPETFIAIDAGTTNSRAWLVKKGVIASSHSVPVGVRDTARDGNASRLIAGLHDLIESVRNSVSTPPDLIAAAGMVTSALGLREVPHLVAPVGPTELAAGAVKLHLPEVSELPIVLFPGVRSGAWFAEEDVESVDMMRGEETLCLGLVQNGHPRPLTVLNLGSHWKAIQVDRDGRIASSWTSLSGEMLHAVILQTVLASAVPAGRPEAFDPEFVERGMEMFRRHGMSRSLFAVRLWEVQAAARATPEQRLSYLVGVFVAEALDAFRRAGYFSGSEAISLIGQGAVVEAWKLALEAIGVRPKPIDAAAVESAFVAGICELIRCWQATCL